MCNALCRMRGATLLYMKEKITDLKDCANHHLKNRESTTRKFYIINLHWMAKRALSYSVDMSNVLGDQESKALDKDESYIFKKSKPVKLADIPLFTETRADHLRSKPIGDGSRGKVRQQLHHLRCGFDDVNRAATTGPSMAVLRDLGPTNTGLHC